jgi:hypothetical protein
LRGPIRSSLLHRRALNALGLTHLLRQIEKGRNDGYRSD